MLKNSMMWEITLKPRCKALLGPLKLWTMNKLRKIKEIIDFSMIYILQIRKSKHTFSIQIPKIKKQEKFKKILMSSAKLLM